VTGRTGLRVTAVGAASVQDLGRPGWAHVGVPHSGALDRSALVMGNRALGNADGAEGIEVVMGGLTLEALHEVRVCLTGAQCPGVAHGEPVVLRAGETLHLAPPRIGMRTYVAVAGGIDVRHVLGSASWDSLSHLGTPPLSVGDVLSVRAAPTMADPMPGGVAVARSLDGPLRLWPGPRVDWFENALAHLVHHVWSVSADSNRVGLRLDGSALVRARQDELPSEGIVTGAVQVPHDGRPIVMLADHPTTGGYPVVAVVDPGDLDRLAQVRPGERLRFRRALAQGGG
jgi:biotin-dependent carboxylase-like uncharacterized protein